MSETTSNKTTAAEMIAAAKDKVANAAAPATRENVAATRTGRRPGAESGGDPSADAEKKGSPKSKAARGVDPSLITTWVPSDNTAELNEILNNAAKHRNVNVGNMMAEILAKAIADNLDSLKEDAAKYEPASKGKSIDEKLAEMTPEQLEAFIAKQQAAMDALKAKVANLSK